MFRSCTVFYCTNMDYVCKCINSACVAQGKGNPLCTSKWRIWPIEAYNYVHLTTRIMLEKYITPVLMYYLQKYVKNIQPQDLQLSFWGGDAVLKNLQLRCDVLEDELSHLPFVVTAGKIQELTIHVPWTTLGSEPVEITAVNIDCSAAFRNGEKSRDERSKDAPRAQGESQTAETPDSDDQKQATSQAQPPSAGYLQGLLSRIIHNVVFHIKNLSIRIIDVDICVTLHIKGLEYHNTNEQWNRQFIYSDYLQEDYTTQSECDISDMYVTLDQLSGGGQVEEYEDPLTSGFALIVRMMSTYRNNMLKSKRIEFWCTCLDFSVTPRQFCLISRLFDRVLAIYYSSKSHRVVGGADNATPPTAASKLEDGGSGEAWIITEGNEKERVEEEIVSSSSNVDGIEVDSPAKREEEEEERRRKLVRHRRHGASGRCHLWSVQETQARRMKWRRRTPVLLQ